MNKLPAGLAVTAERKYAAIAYSMEFPDRKVLAYVRTDGRERMVPFSGDSPDIINMAARTALDDSPMSPEDVREVTSGNA